MDIHQFTQSMRENRMRIANELQAHIDACHRAHPGRSFTEEEKIVADRLNERLDELEQEIRRCDETAQRERESNVITEALERQIARAGQPVQQTDPRLRDWMNGEGSRFYSVDVSSAAREKELIRQGAGAEELRALYWDTGSPGSLVPTTVERTVYEYMEAEVAMFRMPTTKINTPEGNPIAFPTVATHGIATQVVAQGTAIGGTDPAFGRMLLESYKYGQLVQVSSETITDAAVDMVDFVFRNIGRGVGRIIDADLVVGTGTNEPRGVITALAAVGGSVMTGGSLIDPTYEKLVDLTYSLTDAYRSRGSGAVWLLKDSTAAVIRKLRDGAGGTVGAPLWQPSFTNGIQGGQPDKLLGYDVYTDVNLAALGSNSRSIAFFDPSAYYVRTVGPLMLERSDDFAFSSDVVTFRGKWRCDGDLIDSNAGVTMVRNV